MTSAATALSETGNDRITMGGNMTPFEIVAGEIESLYAEARNWADGTEIENDEQEAALDTLDKALLKAGQEADKLRAAEKEPYDRAIEEIQARFHPLIGNTKSGKGKVPLAREAIKPILTAYRTRKQAEAAAAAEKARREAEEERRRAEEAMRASSGDLEALEQAEQMLEAARQAERFAKKADKAATTGTGLRTRWVAEMVDQRAAVAAMWKRNPQAFVDLAQELADTAVRGGARQIDGFNIIEQKVAL